MAVPEHTSSTTIGVTTGLISYINCIPEHSCYMQFRLAKLSEVDNAKCHIHDTHVMVRILVNIFPNYLRMYPYLHYHKQF